MSGGAEDLRRRRLAFLRRRRSKSAQTAMTMMEHLTELRTRLMVAGGAFLALSVVAFFFFEPILDLMLEPLCRLDPDKLGPQGCRLITHGPLEAFGTRLKVTAMVGIVTASPIWLYQLWAFVIPGLTRRERRYAAPFVIASVTLFLVGAAVAYTTLPTGLNLLVSLGGPDLVPFFRAEEYLNFIGLMLLGFGVMFELPLVLLFLGLANVISVEQLRAQRRSAIVAIVFLAAIITPSQDPYTLLVLAAPLYLLYELTIAILSAVTKRRAKRAQ